jgi:predicted enzyme related to lactoylglutathione lyase
LALLNVSPTARPNLCLRIPDKLLDDTYRKVKEAGGKIVREIFEFPGGKRFHFSDPNGNELAVWSE